MLISKHCELHHCEVRSRMEEGSWLLAAVGTMCFWLSCGLVARL